MKASRRDLLKWGVAGSTLMTFAGGLTSPASASAPGMAIVPLLGGTEADGTFLAGIETGLAGSGATISDLVLLSQDDSSALARLEHRLVALKGHRIIGLLDEGRQAILDEILRDIGARVLCSGRHTAGGHSGASSNHRFATTPRSRGIGAALADGLALGAEGFVIHETAFGAEASAAAVPVRLDARQGWVGMTGQALARIATETWVPGNAGQYRRIGTDARTTIHHGLVSFAAQL